jgi:hypothetical protein
MPSTELKLLVAPPSADLRAFAAFADERDITVLLPYQRGHPARALMQLGSWLWPMQHPCRCPLTGASMRWVGWTLIRRRSFRFARPLISVAAGSVFD